MQLGGSFAFDIPISFRAHNLGPTWGSSQHGGHLLGTDIRQTNPAGIADAGTASLDGPASTRRIDRSEFSARRPAKTQPAVPPLRTRLELVRCISPQ